MNLFVRTGVSILVWFFLPAAASADSGRISVGVITTLSGGMATIGTAVRNGIELARSEHPELFEQSHFIYEDDQFDAKKSISAYQKLKTVDSISVLIGFGIGVGYGVGPLVERDRIPMINLTFEAGPAVGKTFVMRAMNHTGQYQSALAEYFKQKGSLRFVTIRTEIPFFTAMTNDFRDAMGTSGEVREVGVFNPSDSDFRAVIPKLKTANVPVGLFLLPEQLLQFAKQAKELGLNAEYFGTDLFESAAKISTEPGAYEGAVYADNDASNDFRARYLKAFGNESQLTFAGSAYDMAILVGETLRAVTPYSSEAFLKNLREVRNHEGVLGRYSYQNDAKAGAFFEYPVKVKHILSARGVPAVAPGADSLRAK